MESTTCQSGRQNKLKKSAAVLLSLSLSFSVHAQNFVNRLTPSSTKEISQLELGSPDACGPLAYMYMLKYSSRPEFNRAYHEMLGDDFQDKAINFMQALASSPSSVLPNQNAFIPHIGISDFEVPNLVKSMVSDPSVYPARVQPIRSDTEVSGDNQFIKRAWMAMNSQIQLGIPILVGVYGRSYQDGEWNKVWGHSITITGIQASIGPMEYSFYFEYLDPWTGMIHDGFIAEELRHSFDTYLRQLDENGTQWEAKYSVELQGVKGPLSSPALVIHSPDLFLGYNSSSFSRELYVLDNLLFFE